MNAPSVPSMTELAQAAGWSATTFHLIFGGTVVIAIVIWFVWYGRMRMTRLRLGTVSPFDLLGCFVQRPRRVLTRDQILDWTRGRSAEPFDRTVDMLISRLRKKLDGASPDSNLITTVRNGGYLFTANVKQVS